MSENMHLSKNIKLFKYKFLWVLVGDCDLKVRIEKKNALKALKRKKMDFIISRNGEILILIYFKLKRYLKYIKM